MKKTWAFLMIFVLIVMSACGKPVKPNASSGSKELTIAIFGGEWGAAVKKHLIQPFENEHGVNINVIEGTSSTTLSRLIQEKNAPTIDIALMDSGISELSYEKGLVDTFDTNALTNHKDVIKEGVQTADGKAYGVALGYWGLGLVYNTEKIKNPPESWMDLWNKEYEDVVTIPTPATTGGLPLLMKVSELSGGSQDDISAGLDKVKELKEVAYFDGSGTASNLYQSGEAWIGAHYGGPAHVLKEQGVPLEFVIPKEGVLGAGSFWHIVKGTDNKELAQKFLNEAIGVKAQKGVAEDLYLAPVNKKVTLSENVAKKMPFGRDGSIEDLNMPDYQKINEHREEWNDLWNREIGK